MNTETQTPEETPKELTLSELDALDNEVINPEETEETEEIEKTKEIEVEEVEEEKPTDDTAPDEEDVVIETSFWDDVDALHGEDLEVEYGNVDPTTPEGAFIRENAVAERAIERFEDTIKANNPRAYAYLLHTLDGGTDEDFFEKAAGIGELPTEEQLEVDVELQKSVIERNLRAKGNSDRQIKALIKIAEEDDELEEMSKEALIEEKKNSDKALKQLEDDNAAELNRRDEQAREMVEFVDATINTGKIGNLIIPVVDRRKFADSFKETLRYENGKFLSVTELTEDSIQDTFQKEYFKYKKGNLEGLIERSAKTVNTKRLIKNIDTTPRARTNTVSSSKNIPMSEL